MTTHNNAGPSHKNPANFVRNGTPVGKLEVFASLVADEAINGLTTKGDKSKPFFLTVWTHEPHLPIETDPQFQKPYADSTRTSASTTVTCRNSTTPSVNS